MSELKNKKIVQSRQWLDTEPTPIPNLDYDLTYPITVFDAVRRNMDDNSSSLTDELESIYRLINDKQNIIEGGNPGNLMTWTGSRGNIGSMNVVKTINPDPALRSNEKIPTEKAVGAIADLKASHTSLQNHINDGPVHTNDQERTRWNSMAPLSSLQSHIGNINVHISSNERVRWNAKADQEDFSEHIYNTNNPHNVTANQVGSYSRSEVNIMFEELRQSFFNYMNIEWDPRTNQAKIVEYHPANWNPNYVLGVKDALPDVPDETLTYFAIKPATDYETNESDDVIIYIKQPGLLWQEIGYHIMNAGDMLIRFPDTCMFVWVQGRFLRLFSDSGGAGGGDLDGNVWRPTYNKDTGELTWELSDSEEPPDPSMIKGADGYTPVKGVDYDDGADGKGIAIGGQISDLLVKLSDDNFDTTWKSFEDLMNDLVTQGYEFPENLVRWESIQGKPIIYDNPGNNKDGVMTQHSVTDLFTPLRLELDQLSETINSPITGVANLRDTLYDHLSDYGNPHRVSPSIIGAVSIATFNDHVQNFNNPHHVNMNQLGFGNINNTSDLDKPISAATQEALAELLEKLKDVENGSINLDYVADVVWDDTSSKFTFTFNDDSTLEVEIPIGDVISSIKNMYFDDVTKNIVVVLPDGTKNEINIGSIIMSGSTGTHINVHIDDNVIRADLLPNTIGEYEIVNSVILRGSPTTTTQAIGDRSTRIATTEFVKSQVIDNLISYETGRALSANQGRILNQKKADIDQVIELINEFEGIHVVDNLESTNAAAGLSANMGRHLDLTKAPRVHTSPSGATFGRATVSLFGHMRAGDVDPIMDGTVFKGTDNGYAARSDHRHPSDITKADINDPEFTGVPTIPTPPDDSNDKTIPNTEWVRRNMVGVVKGFSTTASADNLKIVKLISDFVDPPVFLRQTGSTVAVTFTVEDTSIIENPTQLDVQGSGPALITFGGKNIVEGMIGTDYTHLFTYDGTTDTWKLLNPGGVFMPKDDSDGNDITTTGWVYKSINGITEGDSSTGGTNADKIVELRSDHTSKPVFKKQSGATIVVNFTQTDISSVTTPTRLNVQGSGLTTVHYQGKTIVPNMISVGNHIFTYDGTVWQLLNPAAVYDIADNDNSNKYASTTWVRNYTYSKAEANTKFTNIENTINNITTNKTPTYHASGATTYGRSTVSLYGHAIAANTLPTQTASAGNIGADDGRYARAGHVHQSQQLIFIQASAPGGEINRLWVNTTSGIMYYFNGSKWNPVSAHIPKFSGDPAGPIEGQVWIR